jgi:hypothetical protein
MKNILQHYNTLLQLLRLPVAHLSFDRTIHPAQITATYRYYTMPHPRYKVIRHKSVGAALVDLEQMQSRAHYLDHIKGKNRGAWHARRASARGYRFAEIDRNRHVDAIHAINTSVDLRQGRPMDRQYLEKQERFEAYPHYRHYGMFNADGRLVGYADLGLFGNFAGFERLIGERNNDGFMHLLVIEIVGQLIEQKRMRYLMYDTFFGAQPGMRNFKTVLGFRPYRAKYSLL